MRPFGVKTVFCLVVAALAASACSTAFGDGSLHGHAQFERVKGRPDLGYYQLYEYKGGDGIAHGSGSGLEPYTDCDRDQHKEQQEHRTREKIR